MNAKTGSRYYKGIYTAYYNLNPAYLKSSLQRYSPARQLRSSFLQTRLSNASATCSTDSADPRILNSLASHRKSAPFYSHFKTKLKTYITASKWALLFYAFELTLSASSIL